MLLAIPFVILAGLINFLAVVGCFCVLHSLYWFGKAVVGALGVGLVVGVSQTAQSNYSSSSLTIKEQVIGKLVHSMQVRSGDSSYEHKHFVKKV